MSKAIKENLDLAHSSNIYLPTRTLFITGEITEATYQETIINLHALDTDPQAVHIYINSEGGDFNSGMAIYNAIKAMKSLVRGFVFGEASSIASIILQACDERIIVPHGYIMIHAGSDGAITAPRHVQQAWRNFEDHQAKLMEDIYLEKIKHKKPRYSRKQLQSLLKTDTILKSKEALELGLVDLVKDVI